jgi:hypothetical protein
MAEPKSSILSDLTSGVASSLLGDADVSHEDATDDRLDSDSAEVWAGLTSVTQTVISSQPVADVELPAKSTTEKYFVLECYEGQWPKLVAFKTLTKLATRISELDGKDVVAFAFHGSALPISKGPRRCIVLPTDQLLRVPLYNGAPCELVPAGEVEVQIETDGYMGPAELRLAMDAEIELPK